MALSESASTIFMPGDSKPSTRPRTKKRSMHRCNISDSLQFSTYSMEMFAQLLHELDRFREGDGTLLDQMLVLGYTDVSFAKIHALDGIPMFLAGRRQPAR